MLRSVSEPRSDSNEIASCSVVDRFRAFQMPGEGRGPGNHVGEVGVFGGQIERTIGAVCPAGPGLKEKLARIFRNSCVVNHCASHRDKGVFKRGASGCQLVCISMPEPDYKETIER